MDMMKEMDADVQVWMFPVTSAIISSDIESLQYCIDKGAPIKKFKHAVSDAITRIDNNRSKKERLDILCLLLKSGAIIDEDDEELLEDLSEKFPIIKQFLN